MLPNLFGVAAPLPATLLLEIPNGWTAVMKNFSEQWKALEDKKDGEEPEKHPR
jgi:hypothetical protein